MERRNSVLSSGLNNRDIHDKSLFSYLEENEKKFLYPNWGVFALHVKSVSYWTSERLNRHFNNAYSKYMDRFGEAPILLKVLDSKEGFPLKRNLFYDDRFCFIAGLDIIESSERANECLVGGAANYYLHILPNPNNVFNL